MLRLQNDLGTSEVIEAEDSPGPKVTRPSSCNWSAPMWLQAGRLQFDEF